MLGAAQAKLSVVKEPPLVRGLFSLGPVYQARIVPKGFIIRHRFWRGVVSDQDGNVALELGEPSETGFQVPAELAVDGLTDYSCM